MEVKVNNSEQNINLTLTQGQNPINIQLKPSEPQDISVSLKPKSSPLEFAIATPIVRPIHFGLAPNVIKEIISGGSHLYDLYDVQADGNSVFGALADAVLTYDADGRWKAVLPSELTITKNGDPIGTYKLRGKNQTIDIAVPTLISQLSNDKGYITEEELSIALDSIKGIQFFVVDVLPTPSKDTLSGIYLVRKLSSQSGNYYEEYITITRGGSYVWEKIGDTSINLSGYATKEDLEEAVDESRGYTDNKNEELKDYVEGVRKEVITSVEDTIKTTTEQIASTQEHLIEVERDLRETSERLDEESERLRNVKAELDGELALAQIEIDKANASIESVAFKVDESAGTINEVKETLDATNLTLSETVTKLDENTGNITQIRNELNGIDETIVSVIESQVEDEDSKLIQTIGLLVDNKNKEIELAVKAIQEGTDESTVSWVGQKIDAADQEIKTAIETMIYGEGYTETKTIGQVIDGKMDEITTQVLKSEELVGKDGVIQQNINGAYTQWGIDSIKNSVSAISGVLSENGELIDVKTKFSTIEQDLGSILLTVGETEDYEGETILEKFAAISLKIDQVGLSVTNGDNYAAIVAQINKEGSEVLIEADKIHLLGETVAEQLTAQSATIGNLTLTNAVVSGTINANAGNIGGWQIGPASAKGTYLYGGNLILSSEGYIKNQQGDKVHFTLNNDGSGSLADGNIWWDNEGALYFSGNAIVVTEDSEASQGKALAQLVSDVSKVLSMFDIDAANNAVYVKGDRNFYAFGEITALGQGTGGSGGGGGEGGADLLDVWISIAGDRDSFKDYQVNASHLTAYLTRAQIQETYATKEDLENIDIPTLTESDPIFKASAAYGITTADIANWNSKTSNVGTITGIKMNGVSKGTSGVVDLGTVITEHQSLADYAKKTYVDTAISNLINGAPTTLDTLKEIADAFAESQDVIEALDAAIGNKANQSDLSALSGRVDTLSGNLQGYATQQWVLDRGYLTSASLDALQQAIDNNATDIGDHENRIATIEDTYAQKNAIPTSLSDLANDVGYITSAALGGLASESWVSNNYLPLSGGMLYNGVDNSPLVVKGIAEDAYIGFQQGNNTSLGAIGINANLGPVYWDSANRVNRILIHSGNIGSQSVNYANSAGNASYASSAGSIDMPALTSFDDYRINSLYVWHDWGGGINTYSDYAFGVSVNSPDPNHRANIGFNAFSNDVYIKVKQGANNWHPWRAIAFTDSNVASAQALITSSGDELVNVNADGLLFLGGREAKWVTVIDGTSIHLRTKNYAYGLCVGETGNVLIGTTTDNGAKLYVKDTRTDRLDGNLVIDGSGTAWGYNYMGILLNHSGEIKGSIGWNTVSLSNGADSAGGLFIRNTISQNHINIYNEGGIYAYTSLFQTNGDIAINAAYDAEKGFSVNNSKGWVSMAVAGGGGSYISASSQLSIYTNNSQRMLINSDGDIIASGEITALGSSSSSDRRLKNIVGRPTPLTLEDIAKLNVISFKWNHRENDKRLKIGLVAQEVQEILPELVGVDRSNYLTLDYSTFGGVVGVMNTKEILSVKSEVEFLKDRVSALENEMERRKIYG